MTVSQAASTRIQLGWLSYSMRITRAVATIAWRIVHQGRSSRPDFDRRCRSVIIDREIKRSAFQSWSVLKGSLNRQFYVEITDSRLNGDAFLNQKAALLFKLWQR